MPVNQKRLADIGIMMAQKVNKIGEAFVFFARKGTPPPGLRELFINVESLARMGAAEMEEDKADIRNETDPSLN